MASSNVSSPLAPAAAPESVLMRGVRSVVYFLGRLALALRYRVRVVGMESLGELEGPALILPNHPAYIDPALVLMALGPALRPRPMLFEDNFPRPVLHPIVKLFNALRVPNLQTASVKARARV